MKVICRAFILSWHVTRFNTNKYAVQFMASEMTFGKIYLFIDEKINIYLPT